MAIEVVDSTQDYIRIQNIPEFAHHSTSEFAQQGSHTENKAHTQEF
jgi:hypothetical protein